MKQWKQIMFGFKKRLLRKEVRRVWEKHAVALQWGAGCLIVAVVIGLSLFWVSRLPKNELVFKRDPSGVYDFTAELPLTQLTTSLGTDDKGAKIEIKRGESSLQIMQPLHMAKISANKGKAVYTDANKNVELHYTLKYNGLKEDIVLNKRPTENLFASAIKLSNVTAQINSDGVPVFSDKQGNYQFHFEKPYAIDAKGEKTNAVRYHLIPAKDASKAAEIIAAKKKRGTINVNLFGMENEKFTDQQYLLMTEVDEAWLKDEKRAFPITIDPSVVHDTTSEFSAGQFLRIKDVGSGSNPKLETYYQEMIADRNTVGLWHLNETANDSCAGSADVCDSSGEANHGVETGTTITTTDQFLGAAARDFDGTNDFVQITTGSELNFTQPQPFTVEAWVKTDTVSGEHIIFNKQRNTANELIINLEINGGVPTFIFGKQNVGSTSLSAPAIVTGKWYHLAGVSDGTTLYLYVNGEVANQTPITITNATQSLADLYIGELYDGTLRWDGIIDEVRLSNVARSASQIKMAAQRRPYGVFTSDVVDFGGVINSWSNLTWDERGVQTGDGEIASSSANLVAEWKFNELSGTLAANSGTCGGTASDCNLTLTNFSSTAGQDVTARSGWTSDNRKWGTGALMLDGTDDYAACTDANCGGTSKLDFTASDNFTLELWFNASPDTIQTTKVLMSKRDSASTSNAGYTFFLNINDQLLCRIGDGTNTALLSSEKSYADSQWHHAVCVVDRTTQKLTVYVDGKVETTPVDTSSVTGSQENAEEVRVGALSNTPSPFVGTVDVARIYRRALPAHEILSNYNAASLDLQTRVGSDTTPNDGSGWEDWKPTSSETTLDALDDNIATGSSGTGIYPTMNEFAPLNLPTNQIWVKYNNTIPTASDTLGTDGRIPLGSNGTGDDLHAYIPYVLKENGIYRMWYSGHDGTTENIYYATSPDGLNWKKYNNTIPTASNTTGTNGRLPVGAAGTGDDLNVRIGTIMNDGGTYRMWYSGNDSTNWRIFYATSPDGLTWTKGDNITANNTTCDTDDACAGGGRLGLGSAATGDDAGTYNPSVIKDGDTYKMWYSGLDGTNWRGFYATSTDGLTWIKKNNTSNIASNGPLNTDGRVGLGGSAGDQTHVIDPKVIKDGDVYKMWHSGYDGSSVARTFMVFSHDGLYWQKVNNDAPAASDYSTTEGRLALGSAGTGDDANAYLISNIIKENGKYKAWYSGHDGTNVRIYYAELVPVPVSVSRETVIKQEGSGSVEITAGMSDSQARTEALWHFEETSGTGAWVKDSVASISGIIEDGDGADGAITVSSSKNINTTAIASGRPICLSSTSCADGIAYRITAPTDGATSVTRHSGSDTLSNGIAAGDEVMLINLQGASGDANDIGIYEFKEVSSVTDSTMTFTTPIQYSYDGTTGSNQKVVVQRVPNYTNVTIQSGGTLTASAWDGLATTPAAGAGYLTGIVAFRATGTVDVQSGGSITSAGLGYAGGAGSAVGGGTQGESTAGTGAVATTANLGGGGGSNGGAAGATSGGGGGGFGAAGTIGETTNAITPGAAGASYGLPTLPRLVFGSGGGGGGRDSFHGSTGGTGGKGGGIMYIAAPTVTVTSTGTISANGAVGSASSGVLMAGGGGGGGAGGSVLISAETTTLGSSLVTATAGTGGTGGQGTGDGGAGGVGRIHLTTRYAVSGTTSPAAVVISGSGDLTPNGAGVTSTIGVVGRGLNFNGTHYLSCTDSNCGTTAKLDPASGNWSMAAWVKTTTLTRQMIMAKGAATGQFAYSFETGRSSDGRPEFLLYNTTDATYIIATGTVPINDGKWHHIAGTYDGTTIAIYIDGQLNATSISKAGTQVIDSTGDFYIGSRAGATNWNGSIDEPTVARMAFSADQVAEMYRLGRDHTLDMQFTPKKLDSKKRLPFYIAADRPGTYLSATVGESDLANYQTYFSKTSNTAIRAWWHLSETAGTGSYIRTSSGVVNGMTLTPTNGAASSSGKIGKGYFFDGTNDYLTCTDANCGGVNQLDPSTGSWSMGAWLNTTKVPQQIAIAKGTTTGQYAYHMYVANGGSPVFNLVNTINGAYIEASASARINDGLWHQVVGTYDGTTAKIYIDGVLNLSSSAKSGTQVTDSTGDFFVGARTDATTSYWKGYIDEPFVMAEALSAEQIRQMVEYPLRTHQITIDFGAVLDSGNLITGSGDTSFTVDGTAYGLASKGSNLFYGDKIIVKENVNGTEYLAQGTVTAVTPSTGAVTIASWDSGSTFPSGGFTASADVFKWQREYMDLTGALDDHLKDVTRFTLNITSGNEGRTIFLDDLKITGDYLTNPLGTVVQSSTGYRYFQYRFIPTSWDTNVSASLVSATMGYNSAPSTPSLDSPSDTATNQSLTVPLLTTTTDTDSDYLRYKIELCTDVGMTTGCNTFNQTVSQTGWSGQDAQSSTAYASGTQATFTLPAGLLAANTTYYWRSYAIDPAGSNTWSATQTPRSFTTVPASAASTASCTLDKNDLGTSIIVQWTDVFTGETDFTVQKSTNGAAFGALSSPAANSTSTTDNSVSANTTYQYRVRANFSSQSSDWCTTSTLSIPATTNTFSFEGINFQ